MLQPVDKSLLDKFEKAAYKSIKDEAVKFGEAVVTVMTQRVEQYLLFKFGEVNQGKVYKLVNKTKEFRTIIDDNI